MEDKSKIIALVESEKTAVIMSILIPNYIWMATGGKSNLKMELLKPIKNRSVVLFPDKGEFEKWVDKANIFNEKGYKLIVSDLIEKSNCKKGDDLVDLYLNNKFNNN